MDAFLEFLQDAPGTRLVWGVVAWLLWRNYKQFEALLKALTDNTQVLTALHERLKGRDDERT